MRIPIVPHCFRKPVVYSSIRFLRYFIMFVPFWKHLLFWLLIEQMYFIKTICVLCHISEKIKKNVQYQNSYHYRSPVVHVIQTHGHTICENASKSYNHGWGVREIYVSHVWKKSRNTEITIPIYHRMNIKMNDFITSSVWAVCSFIELRHAKKRANVV